MDGCPISRALCEKACPEPAEGWGFPARVERTPSSAAFDLSPRSRRPLQFRGRAAASAPRKALKLRNTASAAKASQTAVSSRAEHADSPCESACAVEEPAPSEAGGTPTPPLAPQLSHGVLPVPPADPRPPAPGGNRKGMGWWTAPICRRFVIVKSNGNSPVVPAFRIMMCYAGCVSGPSTLFQVGTWPCLLTRTAP
jgi:hypothetical protein